MIILPTMILILLGWVLVDLKLNLVILRSILIQLICPMKDLQSRLRQAREKNFSLLRRQGAARVEAEGGRGTAQSANEKRGEKVDVFDEALARVGQRLEALSDAE